MFVRRFSFTLSSILLSTFAFQPVRPVRAEVVRVQIDQRSDVLSGRAFGLAGGYEKLIGKVHFAVSSKNRFNRTIVDLDHAPRQPDGRVAFSADLFVLRPKAPDRGNQTLLLEISNRGGKSMLSLFNQGRGTFDPTKASHYGDGFLLERGYTLVWIGWQFDTKDESGRLRLYAPEAQGIRGLVRSDFIVSKKRAFQPLGHVIAGRIGGTEYSVSDPAAPETILTERRRPLDPRRTIPRDRWRFVERGGRIAGIEYAAGFEPGRIYELIYAAENPALVGLGLAAIRDFVAYAKHDSKAVLRANRAIGFGVSQSGRFLRHFLYQGFNADESGRKVFDGIMAHVAGAGRGSFNHRFAQPSRDAQPMEALQYPTDLYPFTDLPVRDPKTQQDAGLLDRARKDRVVPKIFYTNTSYEYWGRAGSLIHTTPDGSADAPLWEETRVYHLAGLQHFSRRFPPRKMAVRHLAGRYVINPNPSAWTLRALLVAMHDWTLGLRDPPPSQLPRVRDETLVPFDAIQRAFPKIPGVRFPRDVHRAFRLDFGPKWSIGIITQHPPRVTSPFVSLVPAVDSDGNDRGGIRIPQLEVPVATYTPWNLRDPSIGAPTERQSFLGAYFPFAATRANRKKNGDPRPSLEERYATFEDYRGRYAAAAIRLVDQGFLLRRDLRDVIVRGEREYHYAREQSDRTR